VDARLDLLASQDLDGVAQLVAQTGQLGHVGELPRRNRDLELAGALEVALDVVALDRRFDLVKILTTQALDDRHLVGEATHAVDETVGQRRRAEATVAPGRPGAGLVLLDHHDLAAGVTFLGEQRRPQSRVASADDAEVGADVANEG
jgi:hypothetical protein